VMEEYHSFGRSLHHDRRAKNINGDLHYPRQLQEDGDYLARGRKAPRSRSRLHHQHQMSGNGTVPQNFVSFYFTNVPAYISYIMLRQGFEVCGIMEDVYLAIYRNVNGWVFGFLRYGKVKDVDKLLKVVNNVWYGDRKVVAKVASFDRFGNSREARGNLGEGEKREGEGEKIIEREKRKMEGENIIEGEKKRDSRDAEGGCRRVERCGVGEGVCSRWFRFEEGGGSWC